DADVGHRVLRHAAVAVSHHPFLVKAGRLLRIEGCDPAAGVADGQFVVFEQFFQVVPEAVGTSADIGENDGDHFFGKVVYGVNVAIQVGHIAVQIDLPAVQTGPPPTLCFSHSTKLGDGREARNRFRKGT